jgi:hypothetical protein
MGGNALKNVETRRVREVEYFEIRDEVLAILRGCHDQDGNRVLHDCMDIQAYRTKTDFGDLDILVETFSGDNINYSDLITRLFSPTELVHNSNVYSFDYQKFQVDLILTPTEDYVTSYSYYAWNDLGNLAGRIYKKLGFKYGHRGLSYMFRDENNSDNTYAECVVSRELKAILEFGDLDYDQFVRGFDTVEQMFRWVSSSKYFHRDIYLLHNRNHISRTRDKKRKIYNEFLKWCEVTQNLPEYPWIQMREQDGYACKPEFLRLALKQFPGFAEEHSRIKFLHEQSLRAKEKFNGVLVSQLTGLKGKALGVFMKQFIEQHGGKSVLNPKLFHATSQQIEKMINEFHEILSIQDYDYRTGYTDQYYLNER